MTESLTTPEKNLAVIHTATSARWRDILSFRKVAFEGLPLAREKFIAERKDKISKMGTAAEWDDEKVRQAAKDFAEHDEKWARRAIDGASLVFAHAALDGAAEAYFLAIKPADWEEYVDKKTLSLAEWKETTYEEAFNK